MTHGSEPRDPWRKEGDEPTAVQPVPGPFPAPPYPSESYQQPYQPGPAAGWGAPTTPYPAADPNAPAWARQAHAQGAYQPAPPPAGGHIQPMFPPTAQQQPFQQPGYGPAGYRPGPTAPDTYPPNAYPPPTGYAGYPPGPYPGAYPRGPLKPGVITGAAVLAFVHSGLLVFGGVFTLSGVGLLQSMGLGVTRGAAGTLTVMGILTLVTAGLLIAGGVSINNRKPQLLIVGCALSLLLSAWWALRFDVLEFDRTWPLILAALPIISLALALAPTARAWTQAGTAGR